MRTREPTRGTPAGAKAERLQRLQRAGFPVPPFFSLAAREIADADDGSLAATFVDWARAHEVEAVAVRSSADVEDGAERSYAGQFATRLDVRGADRVVEAIREVAGHRRAAAYGDGPAEVGVVVQAMVNPTVSGVLFTAPPSGAEGVMVIEAAPGLGTAVVEGRATHRYEVEAATGELRTVTALEGSARDPELDPARLWELAELGRRIERLFGGPQDVEWAATDDGIHVLQARPITALGETRVWDSSNIAESYPGVTLPLTLSVARRAYAGVYESQARASGLSEEELQANRRLFGRMLGVFRGRLFYNLDAWYEYAGLFPNARRSQEGLDAMIQTDGRAIHREPPDHPLGWRLRYWARMAWRVPRFRREIARFDAEVTRQLARVRAMSPAPTVRAAFERYLLLEQRVLPRWSTTVDNDFLAMTYHRMLDELGGRWLGPEGGRERKAVLLGGIGGVAGAEQALGLERIVDGIREREDVAGPLGAGDLATAWERIRGTELERAIQEHRRRFGARLAFDLKLEVPAQLEAPEAFLGLVGAYLRQPRGRIAAAEREALEAARRRRDELLERLSPVRRLVLRWLLGRLRWHLRERERMRAMRAEVFDEVRRALREAGELLARDGHLERPDDVYYLEVDEVVGFVEGHLSIDSPMPLVHARREEFARYRDEAVPDRFVTRGLAKAAAFEPPSPAAGRGDGSLEGLACSGGVARGRASVLIEPVVPDEPIEILVVRHTDPAWTALIALASGVVVERGGLLSHAAIVTRELGIPCVIGVEGATARIPDGALLVVDGWTGSVTIEA